MNALTSYAEHELIDSTQAHEKSSQAKRVAKALQSYEYLKFRTSKHENIKISLRDLEQDTAIELPILPDEMIRILKKHAHRKAYWYHRRFSDSNNFNGSPLQMNGKEKDLAIFLQNQFRFNPDVSVEPYVDDGTLAIRDRVFTIIGPFAWMS